MIGLLFVFLEVRVYVSNTFCVDTTSRSDVTGPHTVPPPPSIVPPLPPASDFRRLVNCLIWP